MGTYTPNRNLYKPDIGETGWGGLVNQNWDILDAHTHERSEITDFFASPFWDNIPDKPPVMYLDVVTVMSDYTANAYEAIFANAFANPITITLPSPSKNAMVVVKKIDNSSNPVMIVPSGSELIDGQAQQVLDTPMESITLLSDGINWYII